MVLRGVVQWRPAVLVLVIDGGAFIDEAAHYLRRVLVLVADRYVQVRRAFGSSPVRHHLPHSSRSSQSINPYYNR